MCHNQWPAGVPVQLWPDGGGQDAHDAGREGAGRAGHHPARHREGTPHTLTVMLTPPCIWQHPSLRPLAAIDVLCTARHCDAEAAFQQARVLTHASFELPSRRSCLGTFKTLDLSHPACADSGRGGAGASAGVGVRPGRCIRGGLQRGPARSTRRGRQRGARRGAHRRPERRQARARRRAPLLLCALSHAIRITV